MDKKGYEDDTKYALTKGDIMIMILPSILMTLVNASDVEKSKKMIDDVVESVIKGKEIKE